LSEFIYRPLYDESSRTLGVQRSGSGTKIRSVQKGLREKLLCAGCEGKLNLYETPSAKTWRHLLELPDHPTEANGKLLLSETGNQGLVLSNIDYSVFKLFLLSLLWRAGVSRREEFKEVELGPHAERLRSMIFKKDPGLCHEYPCIVFRLTGVEHAPLLNPIRDSWDGHVGYSFFLGKIKLLFLVSSHTRGSRFLRLALQPEGHMKVIFMDYNDLNIAKRVGELLRGVELPNSVGRRDDQ